MRVRPKFAPHQVNDEGIKAGYSSPRTPHHLAPPLPPLVGVFPRRERVLVCLGTDLRADCVVCKPPSANRYPALCSLEANLSLLASPICPCLSSPFVFRWLSRLLFPETPLPSPIPLPPPLLPTLCFFFFSCFLDSSSACFYPPSPPEPSRQDFVCFIA